MYAWSGPKLFISKREDDPWLRVQLNEPSKITSITVGNRKDCCGERLLNLKIGAGLKNDSANEVVGTIKGPGKTGEKYTIRLNEGIVAEYLTFQLKKKKAILQIEGVTLNDETTSGEQNLNFLY